MNSKGRHHLGVCFFLFLSPPRSLLKSTNSWTFFFLKIVNQKVNISASDASQVRPNFRSTGKPLKAPVHVPNGGQEGTALTITCGGAFFSNETGKSLPCQKEHNKHFLNSYYIRFTGDVDKNSLAELCKNLCYICKRKPLFFKKCIYIATQRYRAGTALSQPQEPSNEPSFIIARARFRARESLSISTLVVSMSSS